MANNNTYKRPVLVWGNSFYINISLEKFNEGAYEDFDLTKATDLKVYLICATHNTEIPLPYEILQGFDNVLRCFVDYRLLHTTSYGVVVEGYDEQDMHFRFEMLPKEGFLIVNNTSGMSVSDDVQVVDISARVGWGISYDGDLTNYYTKSEVDNLIAEIELELGDYYTKDEISELLTYYPTREEIDNRFINYYTKTQTNSLLGAKQDTLVSGSNIKTINNLSLLGSGNIEIEKGETGPQGPAGPTGATGATGATGPTGPAGTTDYNELENKPDLSIYATKTELDDKQDELESGVNIKTINNLSLLGSGNIEIQGGGGSEAIIVEYRQPISNETITQIREQKTNVLMHTTGTSGDLYYPLSILRPNMLEFFNVQYNATRIDWQQKVHIYNITTQEWTYAHDYFLTENEINSLLNTKQDNLVSGYNIKTINNESILGEGNIDIQAGEDYSEQFKTTADALWDLDNRLNRSEYVTNKKLESIEDSTKETLDEFGDNINEQLSVTANTFIELLKWKEDIQTAINEIIEQNAWLFNTNNLSTLTATE